jgi:hypothetical protein
MCSRPLGWIPLLLAGLPLAAQGPAARPSADRIRTLQARADSLEQLWSEANALANLADSLAHSNSPSYVDTLAVGSLRIISNVSPLPLKAAAERAWPSIDSLYGSAARDLENRPYLIRGRDPDSAGRRDRSWGIPVRWDMNEKDLADLLLVYVPMPAPDPAFRQWFGDQVRPSTRGRRSDLEQSYIALVTSPYAVGRDCYLGSIGSCRSALGLDAPADPIRWFQTPTERHRALTGTSLGYQSGASVILQACQAGRDPACIEVLRLLRPSQLPRPMALIARQTLVRIALELGGREAYHRLMSDSVSPLPERLAGAAGLPLDTLLVRWRSSVLAARPAPVVLPPFGAVVGMGWTLVFGVCALRSSRWRVG